jgi:hypothetical protein
MRLNLLFTGRLPTITSFVGTFILLGIFRSWLRQEPLSLDLVVLTGIPAVLFIFYMITDPMTSPSRLRSQIFFGSGIACAYFVLLTLHVQYMMFYSVTIVCALRGLGLFVLSLRAPSAKLAAVPVATTREWEHHPIRVTAPFARQAPEPQEAITPD